jgi:hypothetical protein
MVDAVDEDEAAIEGQCTAAARGAHFYLLTEAALHRLPMNPVNVVVGATLLQTSNSTPGKSADRNLSTSRLSDIAAR